MFRELSLELKEILQRNFRDNERIDRILSQIFNSRYNFHILSMKFDNYKKISKFNRYESLTKFLKSSQSDNIDILQNHLVKEHALFIILKTNKESFYDFFMKYTLKHYGYLIESTVLDISPFQNESRNNALNSILKEIFMCNEYREILNIVLNNELDLNTEIREEIIGIMKQARQKNYKKNYNVCELSKNLKRKRKRKKGKINKINRLENEENNLNNEGTVVEENKNNKDELNNENKINRLFEPENRDKLESILFFFVKHGNSHYWKNKTKRNLF